MGGLFGEEDTWLPGLTTENFFVICEKALLEYWTHLEEDKLRVCVRNRAGAPQAEVWYWARLNSIDPKPLVIPLNFQKRRADAQPAIRVGQRGWSTWTLVPLTFHTCLHTL